VSPLGGAGWTGTGAGGAAGAAPGAGSGATAAGGWPPGAGSGSGPCAAPDGAAVRSATTAKGTTISRAGVRVRELKRDLATYVRGEGAASDSRVRAT
jgi:hypothetical protein